VITNGRRVAGTQRERWVSSPEESGAGAMPAKAGR
jgi:hypothetical protein